MKTTLSSNLRPLLRAFCPFLIGIAALWAMPTNAPAQVYVAQIEAPTATGFVSEYSTTGELINANFITGLLGPSGLVLWGNILFVANGAGNTVGKYDATTGGVINASFITAVQPVALAASFNSLFVTHNISESAYAVGVYDATTGAAINANFITGINFIYGLELLGNELFVTSLNSTNGFTVGKYNATTGAAINPSFFHGRQLILAGRRNTIFGVDGLHLQKVGKYNATTGAAINRDFITGLKDPSALAVLGNKLFVASAHPGSSPNWVSEYNATTGAEINVPFIEAPNSVTAIAVQGTE
jgi:hypothetical protein